MKKVLILILAMVLSFSVFALAACQTPCETHVDANHDGICDVCKTGDLTVTHADSNHDGKCDVCAGATTFEHTDAAHDGKCDVCGQNVEVVHVDANNDGICDVEACGHEYAWVDALAAAKEYVNGLYLNAGEATTADYTITTVVAIGGVKYDVAWKIVSDVADQTAVALGDVDATTKQQTVNVDEFSAAEVAYKLVATISDAEGHNVVVEYARKVPQFVVATWEEYVAACEASDAEAIISVRGYVTAVNADSGSSSKGSVWIRDAEGHGYYAYKPTLDASVTASRESILAEFPVGAEVVISGTVGNKYGNQHNAGCTIIHTGKTAPAGWNTPVDQTEAFSNASGMLDMENLEQYYGSMVTLKGITMGNIDGYNYYFTINGKEYICYMNIYLMDSEASAATAAKWVVGGKANLTGLVTTYSKKFQIYPYGPDCLEIIKEDLTDAQIVERAKAALAFDFDHATAAVEKELPTEIAGYDVTLAWALDATYDFASISEGKLVISALPAAETTIKLIATITKGDASDVKEYPIVVDAKQVGPVTSIALTAESLGLAAYADGTATVSGVEFGFIELGTYGDGIQSRNKTKASALWNNVAFSADIESIVITINETKSAYDNKDVFMFSFGATADALTEEISHNESAGVMTYTITPSAGARFFKMVKTNTYTSYYGSIVINLASGETVEEGLVAGTAYTMSVNQKTLGKTLYFNGQTKPNYAWYFMTSEAVADAAKVYVEEVTGGYKLYFMAGETKTYIRLYERDATGGKASLELVTEAPAEVYTYDAEYKTLVLTSGENKYYIGTYDNYDTLSGSNYKYISSSFACVFTVAGEGTVTPPTPAHTCESACPICKGCLDAECTEAACTTKCTCPPPHECESVCPVCEGCTDSECTEKVCATKCECIVVDATNLTAGQLVANAEIVEGTGVYATTPSKDDGKRLVVDESTASIDGFSFTQRIKLGGSMKVSGGVVTDSLKLELTGACKIVLYVKSASSDADRTLRIAKLVDDALVSLEQDGTALATSVSKIEYAVDEAGTYYIGSVKDGINIYGIIIAYEPEKTGATLNVSIADLAKDNSWENGKPYTTLNLDSVITVTASGTAVGNWGLNTGKYYTDGATWRIYQNETPSVTISAAEGYSIVSVKVTYAIKNTGTLTLGTENIASGTVVDVNDSTITFSVGNTGTATNGQAQITAIEVVYAPAK